MKIFYRPLFAILFSTIVLFAASSARATTVYALTNDGRVLTFDHLTPGTITNDVALGGLGGFELLAIDVRPTVQPTYSQPGVGTLWGIGRSGTSFQLFVINPVTGAATAIGSPIAAGINGAPANTEWGFDFNPGTDRIRLVNSSFANNYRLNPNNGQIAFFDASLAYAVGDTHFGTAPQVDAAAYTTAAFGGASTLYYLDSNLNILASSASPDSGQLQTVGASGLGVDIDQPNGFDIYGGLALFSTAGAPDSLYSVDTTTGVATLIGTFPALVDVRGLAIAIPPPPVGLPFLRISGPAKRTTTGSRADLKIRSFDESGSVAVSFRVVKQSASYKVLRSSATDPNLYTAIVRRLQFGNNRVIVHSVDPEGNLTIKQVVIVRKHQTNPPPAAAAP